MVERDLGTLAPSLGGGQSDGGLHVHVCLALVPLFDYPTPMARGLAVDRWRNGRDDAMAGTLLGLLLPQPVQNPLGIYWHLAPRLSTL